MQMYTNKNTHREANHAHVQYCPTGKSATEDSSKNTKNTLIREKHKSG
jgi:hypothetical protein